MFGLAQRIEIDGHGALIDRVIDGAAFSIDEVEHRVADAAGVDEFLQRRLRNETLRQRGRMRADIAAGDDGEVERFGQIIKRRQPAFFDQRPFGLDGIHQKRCEEHVTFRPERACQPPGVIERVGLMHGDDTAEQRDDLAVFPARRAEAGKRSGHGAAPADANGGAVRHRFGEKLPERQAHGLGRALDACLVGGGNDDGLIQPVSRLQPAGQFNEILDALVDPDLHLGALHRLVQKADDGGAADAELLGDVFLRHALIIIKPCGAQPQRSRFRIGRMGFSSQFRHGFRHSLCRRSIAGVKLMSIAMRKCLDFGPCRLR
ncbi:hypothetical protein D3C71_793970 [compost metagenome]